jgi:nitroreductase
MNGWLAAGRAVEDPFFKTALSVMYVYFERHRLLAADVSEFRKLFSAGVLELVAKADDRDGGVMPAAKARDVTGPVTEGRAFLDVIHGRRSVREFTAAPVTEEELQRAVEIAMQAPSVCNRQAARVHLISDPKLIQAAVDLQGGFGGYNMPPKLLLVTCDLTAFLFTTERNQAFIDGGLFMMTLLLGLESVGLGSCSLNTAMGAERENKIRSILGIPENEVFISFVAVGHFDPMILTPRSKRITVDDVLIRHDKG